MNLITERCGYCNHETTIDWNIEERGYKAFCPVCGKTLMFCSECMGAIDNKEEKCDWQKNEKGEGICFRILEKSDC